MQKVQEHVPDRSPRHLVRSHAHEQGLPGTVNMQAQDGDDTGYGLALYPVPADDPNDPLQWPAWRKTMILVICAVYSLLGNAANTGPSPYIGLFIEEFYVGPTVASGLISYPNLAYGFGTLLLIPAYMKFGRRPVMLVSIVIFLVGLIGASRATTLNGLMAWRIIHALGSGVCEALPVQLVNDIFYIHERGTRLGYYSISLCLGSTGPFFAAYMLRAGLGWRLLFYVLSAFAALLLIFAFFFVEETMYDRPAAIARSSPSPYPPSEVSGPASATSKAGFVQDEVEIETGSSSTSPTRHSYVSTLKPWSRIDHDAPFFSTILRSFAHFFNPAVFWVIATFGMYIGIGALSFSYTFPIKIVQPPYLWSQENSGMYAVASFIGYALAVPFLSTSDRLAAHLTKKNGGVREAEHRLGALIPGCFVAPVGLIVYGLTAQHNLHWIGYFIGVFLLCWGAIFYFTFTLAYAVDSYFGNTSEMLIAMNLGKAAVSFGVGGFVLDWVFQYGYAVLMSGIFTAVLFASNLLVFVFMIWGKSIRRTLSSSALGKFLGKTRSIE